MKLEVVKLLSLAGLRKRTEALAVCQHQLPDVSNAILDFPVKDSPCVVASKTHRGTAQPTHRMMETMNRGCLSH
jgi:hypothetical protein